MLDLIRREGRNGRFSFPIQRSTLQVSWSLHHTRFILFLSLNLIEFLNQRNDLCWHCLLFSKLTPRDPFFLILSHSPKRFSLANNCRAPRLNIEFIEKIPKIDFIKIWIPEVDEYIPKWVQEWIQTALGKWNPCASFLPSNAFILFQLEKRQIKKLGAYLNRIASFMRKNRDRKSVSKNVYSKLDL